MAETFTVKSTFAILDVQEGREELRKRIGASGKPIHVTITGTVDLAWGADDGKSQEFSIDVVSVDFGKVA